MLLQSLLLAMAAAFINMVRGGLLDKFLPEGRNDDIAALAFGCLAGAVYGEWWSVIAFAAAFRLGESPAWGHWLGVAIGSHTNREEKSPIDKLLKKVTNLDLWAFLGLTIRGAAWGMCIAAPAAFLSPLAAIGFIVAGSLFGIMAFISRHVDISLGWRWKMTEGLIGAAFGLPFIL